MWGLLPVWIIWAHWWTWASPQSSICKGYCSHKTGPMCLSMVLWLNKQWAPQWIQGELPLSSLLCQSSHTGRPWEEKPLHCHPPQWSHCRRKVYHPFHCSVYCSQCLLECWKKKLCGWILNQFLRTKPKFCTDRRRIEHSRLKIQSPGICLKSLGYW